MLNFRRFSTTAALCLIALQLQGCGTEIDARQTQEINGLLYKLNDNDPFTGKVTNYPLPGFLSSLGSCTLQVKKGQLDGTFTCISTAGVKLAEIEYKDGAKNGLEKTWDSATSNLKSKVEWKNNRKDGLEESYDPNNKNVKSQINWANGIKNGSEKNWESDGKTLYVDLNWKDGKKTGFVKSINQYAATFEGPYDEEYSYKDGLLHGIQRHYGVGEYTRKMYVRSQTNYAEGKPDGLYQEWDENKKLILERQYKNGVFISENKVNSPVQEINSTNAPSQGAPAAPVPAVVAVAPMADSSPFAPSFDCVNVSTGSERLICSDRELSKLDIELNSTYSNAREKSLDKKKLKSEQIGWVKTSRNACSERSCMVTAYQQRIEELSK